MVVAVTAAADAAGVGFRCAGFLHDRKSRKNDFNCIKIKLATFSTNFTLSLIEND